jgi:hypothetical protein
MTDCVSPEDFYELEGIPFIKNPLNFFSSTKTNRYLLVISDNPNSWKKDMVLAEKMFGHLLISNSSSEFSTEFLLHQEVLRHRLKVPGIQNNPELMKTAKIWILPNKLIKAPPPDILLNSLETSIQPLLQLPQGTLSYVKIDLTEGKERMMVYRILDDGYRPGLLCVKWTNDLDEHYATAYCAGHLMNAGYIHVMTSSNKFSLYYYSGLSLYDSCSMKDISWGNPIAQAFIASSKEPHEEDKKEDDSC